VAHGGEADLGRHLELARTAVGEAFCDHAPPQRRSMRMIHLDRLLLVDLPVDVIVVLEQQERADEAKRIERTLPQS
jgi:DNA-binding IclR family transcriptional regulator